MKHRKAIQYYYYAHSISEGAMLAYEAIIPAFDNAVVFGDSLEELEKGIRFAISSEIAERKKQKKPIPEPDMKKQQSQEKHGIDFFIDPPEDFLIKKKGIDVVKLIRSERD